MKNKPSERKVVLPLPDDDATKKQQVAEMFDRVAGKYDFLNRLLSMRIDRGWRKKAIKSIATIQPKTILDVATGTGDLAIAGLKANPESIIGVDISNGMLEVGKQKIADYNLQDKISLQYGDSENLPFEDSSFDAITCAYGVRNFENLERGLQEMHRVLNNNGKVAILEFSRPKSFPMKQLYGWYFTKILPKIGNTISKDATAYDYLPASVMAFPEGNEFVKIMESCGFHNCKAKALTFGITTLYTAEK